jgi:Common central domain of tyrosinase
MVKNSQYRVRRSLHELQDEYTKGNKKPLEDLMRAWYGIKALPYDDPKSFFVLGGYHAIPNPLRSFVLPRAIHDHIGGIDANNAADYGKPAGYETVRYPRSGLVGTASDRTATAAHNAQWSDYKKCVRYLNNNIIDWLTSAIIVDGAVMATHVVDKYKKCLSAPNYTVFSNASSRDQWNDNQPADQQVECLEAPHGAIHLAVGGIQVPTQNEDMIAGANGDMGENDTAGLDPIFFFSPRLRRSLVLAMAETSLLRGWHHLRNRNTDQPSRRPVSPRALYGPLPRTAPSRNYS